MLMKKIIFILNNLITSGMVKVLRYTHFPKYLTMFNSNMIKHNHGFISSF